MIIYRSDKAGFARDVDADAIERILLRNLKDRRGYGVGPSEVRSWHQSLKHMRLVLADPGIPDDSGVSVELQIPQTTKRIDFLLSGRGEDASDHAVIVELKQWETAQPTEMDGLVRTFLGGAERDTAHPSYQAWSYAELLKDFNRAVYEGDCRRHPHLRGLPRLREAVGRAVGQGSSHCAPQRPSGDPWARLACELSLVIASSERSLSRL